MSQPSHAPSGYSWSGTLKNTNIRQLYERCQRLRLTGKMQLRQGDQALELVWIGGEPIETETDQGTRSLPLWNNGDFQVEQCIPDWKGHLTGSVELTGSLRAGQIQAIYKLCSDNQLSADVELKRQSGELAQVRFTLGKAEAATISGQTESALTALSKLSAWGDGTFRVVLRPLFGDIQAAEAPVFNEKGQSSDDQFDVTGSLDIARGNLDWPPKGSKPAAASAPVPMGASGRSLPGAGAAAAPAAVPTPVAPSSSSANKSGGSKSPSHLNATVINSSAASSNSANPAVNSAPTVPMSTMSRENAMKMAMLENQAAAAAQKSAPQPAAKPGRTLAVVSIVVIVLCALAVGGLIVWKQVLGGNLGSLLGSPPAAPAAPASPAPAPAPAEPASK